MTNHPLAADLDGVLDRTRELWEELRGNRIFVTGGTGFFGCWLLESFAWANYRLALRASALVLTRHPSRFRQRLPHLADDPAISLHLGDVRDFEFPGGAFTHVLHAAGDASAASIGDPLEVFDTIVLGARRVLDFALAAGARKLLFTSSGAVYGSQPPDLACMPETYSGAPNPCDPRSAYGEGKRAAELLCALYHGRHGLEPKIVRCFAFIGPYMPFDGPFAVGNFIRDVLERRPIAVLGDGTPIRSYMYTADLAVWLWTILFRGAPCCPYNVGSEDPLSIAQAASAVATGLGSLPAPAISADPIPGRAPLRYVPSTARARSDLSLSVVHSLASAAIKTAEWARVTNPGDHRS